MNPKYFQIFLGCKVRPPKEERSRGGGLNILRDLEKWNISVLECSMMRPNFERRLEAIL